MEKFANEILGRLRERITMAPMEVPEEVREVKRMLGNFKINMYNWQSEKMRKISVMKASMAFPVMNIFALETYPESGYDFPLLAIDFSGLKKKTFVYISFLAVINDPSYLEKYISPMKAIHQKYAIGRSKEPKEWLLPYTTEYTQYSMVRNTELGKAMDCAHEFLDLYLDMAGSAEKNKDAAYVERFDRACLDYCDVLSEKDGSRQMLGKIIGMKKANIIFNEVIR